MKTEWSSRENICSQYKGPKAGGGGSAEAEAGGPGGRREMSQKGVALDGGCGYLS